MSPTGARGAGRDMNNYVDRTPGLSCKPSYFILKGKASSELGDPQVSGT
jgi:hypothetical protein